MATEYHTLTGLPSTGVTTEKSLVKIENDEGRLRLRFTHGGKRYALAIGLPDSKMNRLVAAQKAAQIELDIASGNFDATLAKYKPPKVTSIKQEELSVASLFERFMETQSRAKELHAGSLCRYTATLKHLQTYFPSKPATSIELSDAEGFARYLRGKVSTRTAKDYLVT